MPENAPSAGRVVRFGVFELDTGAGELRRSGIKVRVQGQPLLLLDKLVQRPGEVITREDLQRALWPGDTFVDFERSLNTAVQRLRFALSDSSESPRFVETIPRRGYRFIAPVHAGHATPRRLVDEVPQVARPSEPQVAPPTTVAVAEPPAAPAARVRQAVVLLTTGVTAALLAGVLVWSVARPDPAMVTRVVIDLPSGQYLLPGVSPIVVSSDGSRLVYAAQQQGSSQLHLRELDQFLSTPLPGTENAEGPFFSPDAQWVGFFADGQLKKVRASGGEPVSLCDVPGTTFGATWGPSDIIVFASAGSSGLLRVPAGGGTPQPLTTFDEVSGDTSHRLPQFLPGGESILFTIQSQDGSTTALLPLTEDGGQPHILTALGQAGVLGMCPRDICSTSSRGGSGRPASTHRTWSSPARRPRCSTASTRTRRPAARTSRCLTPERSSTHPVARRAHSSGSIDRGELRRFEPISKPTGILACLQTVHA